MILVKENVYVCLVLASSYELLSSQFKKAKLGCEGANFGQIGIHIQIELMVDISLN